MYISDIVRMNQVRTPPWCLGLEQEQGTQEQLQQPVLCSDNKSGTPVSHLNTDCFIEYNAVEMYSQSSCDSCLHFWFYIIANGHCFSY